MRWLLPYACVPARRAPARPRARLAFCGREVSHEDPAHAPALAGHNTGGQEPAMELLTRCYYRLPAPPPEPFKPPWIAIRRPASSIAVGPAEREPRARAQKKATQGKRCPQTA